MRIIILPKAVRYTTASGLHLPLSMRLAHQVTFWDKFLSFLFLTSQSIYHSIHHVTNVGNLGPISASSRGFCISDGTISHFSTRKTCISIHAILHWYHFRLKMAAWDSVHSHLYHFLTVVVNPSVFCLQRSKLREFLQTYWCQHKVEVFQVVCQDPFTFYVKSISLLSCSRNFEPSGVCLIKRYGVRRDDSQDERDQARCSRYRDQTETCRLTSPRRYVPPVSFTDKGTDQSL